MTVLNCTTLKNPCLDDDSPLQLLYKPSYCQFCVKIAFFVTMATRVCMRQISVTLLYCVTPKTSSWCMIPGYYLLHKPSYSYFSIKNPKFSLPWQQGQSMVNLSGSVKLLNLEEPLFGSRFSPTSLI